MNSTNPIVANAIATATNAADKKQQFNSDCYAELFTGKYPGWSITLTTDGLESPYSSKSKDECIRKGEEVIKRLKLKIEGMTKAVEWIKANG